MGAIVDQSSVARAIDGIRKNQPLCDILRYENRDEMTRIMNAYLVHPEGLPTEVSQRITGHLKSCYPCNEAYRDFNEVDRLIGDAFWETWFRNALL